jgi:DNA-binding beta-propeller fold protein YncE
MQWGTYGFGDGQFNLTAGVAVDPRSNDVFVVNYHGRNIQKFTRNGVFLKRWGSEGTGDGQFRDPYGVGVDRQGFVYVADKLNDRIQKFDDDGNYLAKWGTTGSGDGQFRGPQNFAWDTDTTFYVTDKDNNRVQKFTGTGVYLLRFGAFGAGDGQFDQPEGICTDRHGAALYVVDWQHHRVERFGAADVGVPVAPAGRLTFALDGPHPARDAIGVRWSLGGGGGGELRLLDVAGRELERHVVAGAGGARLGAARALPAGLYLVELVAGGERRVLRAVLLR